MQKAGPFVARLSEFFGVSDGAHVRELDALSRLDPSRWSAWVVRLPIHDEMYNLE